MFSAVFLVCAAAAAPVAMLRALTAAATLAMVAPLQPPIGKMGDGIIPIRNRFQLQKPPVAESSFVDMFAAPDFVTPEQKLKTIENVFEVEQKTFVSEFNAQFGSIQETGKRVHVFDDKFKMHLMQVEGLEQQIDVILMQSSIKPGFERIVAQKAVLLLRHKSESLVKIIRPLLSLQKGALGDTESVTKFLNVFQAVEAINQRKIDYLNQIVDGRAFNAEEYKQLVLGRT